MGLLDSSSFRNFFFKKRWISVPLLGPLLQLRPRQPLLFEAVRANGRLFWKFLVKKVPLLFTWRNVIFFTNFCIFYYYILLLVMTWHHHGGKVCKCNVNLMILFCKLKIWRSTQNWKVDIHIFQPCKKTANQLFSSTACNFFLFLHKIFCLSLATCIV